MWRIIPTNNQSYIHQRTSNIMAKKLITISICIAILMMFVAFTGCTSSAPVEKTATATPTVLPTETPVSYHYTNGTVITVKGDVVSVVTPVELSSVITSETPSEKPMNVSEPVVVSETKLDIIPVNTT